MKNLFKNNLFKLPFFLLVVSIICTISLSLVNYFTAPKIKQNGEEAIKNACKNSFDNHDNYLNFVIEEVKVNDNLKSLGIEGKDVVKDNDNIIGYVYIGSVQGFADKISFVASYENGKFHKLKVTYEQETNKKGINYIKNNYVDYDLTKPNFFETGTYKEGVAGASLTGQKGLIKVINECSKDYLLTCGT